MAAGSKGCYRMGEQLSKESIGHRSQLNSHLTNMTFMTDLTPPNKVENEQEKNDRAA